MKYIFLFFFFAACTETKINDKTDFGISDKGDFASDTVGSKKMDISDKKDVADTSDSTKCQDCLPGQLCTDGQCACTEESCSEDERCQSDGTCLKVRSCSQVECKPTEHCDENSLNCVLNCTSTSCLQGERCDENGMCVLDTCEGRDPNQCDANGPRPMWDPVKCFCAVCLNDNDCDMSKGETCLNNGTCFACPQACGSAGDPVCGSNLCIESCCLDCISAQDCSPDERCNSGLCGPKPSCAIDPTVCTAGTVCENGLCIGQTCDSNNPASCPVGLICDPATQRCKIDPFGGDCGMCETQADGSCSCPDGECGDPLGAGLLVCSCGSFGICPEGQLCTIGVCL